MKKSIGVFLMAFGAAFGLWAGLYWAFIGGIVDIVNAIKAPEVVGFDIAIGIVKILFAGVIGAVSGVIAVFPGYALYTSKD